MKIFQNTTLIRIFLLTSLFVFAACSDDTPSTPSAECGNEVIEGDEECDGGSDCNADCELIVCGDDVTEGDESCDGGADCNADCELIVCGDSVIEGDEECDGGADCNDSCLIIHRYEIGGTVSGLEGTGLVLQNNGRDDLALSADGAFTFSSVIDDGEAYLVTISAQPASPSQTCTITDASGTVSGSDVSAVSIDCVTHTYSLGGEIYGLEGTLYLQVNEDELLAITSEGSFVFDASFYEGDVWAVAVHSYPYQQFCQISVGDGVFANADAGDIAIECVPGEEFELESYEYAEDGTLVGGNKYILNNEGVPVAIVSSWDGLGEDGILFTDDDGDLSAEQWGYDERYNKSFNSYIIGLGPDEILFTDDDILSSYDLIEYNDLNQQISYKLCEDPGQDGFWVTSDDVFSEFQRNIFTYDDQGRLIEKVSIYSMGSDGVWLTNDDSYSAFYTYEYGSDGGGAYDYSREFSYQSGSTGRGGDGIPFTSDDVISSVREKRTDSAGLILLDIWYSAAGDDASWLTYDDNLVNRYTEYSYDGDANKLLEISKDAGVDTLLGGGDDTVNNYKEWVYDANGYNTVYAWATGSGADSLWFTADDVFEEISSFYSYFVRKYDADGNRTHEIEYDTSGPLRGDDGVWGSVDDPVLRYQKYSYDQDGVLQSYAWVHSSGSDGDWFSSDDPIGSGHWYDYDSQGRMIVNMEVGGPGSDGIWFTVDDVSSCTSRYCTLSEFDADGSRLTKRLYSSGSDSKINTNDDQVTSQTFEKYNEQGHEILYGSLAVDGYDASFGYGDDGIWGTGDDIVSSLTSYSYDLNGNMLSEIYYFAQDSTPPGYGPDGLWYTDDDLVSEEYFYGMARDAPGYY